MKMEKNLKYELYMYEMGKTEQKQFPETYPQYERWALLMLQNNPGEGINEEQLSREVCPPEMIGHSNNWRKGYGLQMRDGKVIQLYYNLWGEYIIQPADHYYDTFFAHKLRQLDLLEVDKFLSYQFARCHSGNHDQFLRFLQLVIRKHGEKTLQPETVQTVQEWMQAQKSAPGKNADTKDEEGRRGNQMVIDLKGRPERGSGESWTKLTLVQTQYLISYLKEGRIIINDDDYLKAKAAGQAFSVLTGYSPDTLRENIKAESFTDKKRKENLSDLHRALTHVINLIENDLKGKGQNLNIETKKI